MAAKNKYNLGIPSFFSSINIYIYAEKQRVKKKTRVFCTGINNSTKALSPRTTYDRIFFVNELIKTFMERTGKKDVSARMLSNAFRQVSAERLIFVISCRSKQGQRCRHTFRKCKILSILLANKYIARTINVSIYDLIIFAPLLR